MKPDVQPSVVSKISYNVRHFVKSHPIWTLLAATVITILGVVAVSIYADSQLYDYQTVGDHQATGLGIHISVPRTLVRYDGQQFLRIATQGYADPTSAAFLPLYPLMARSAHALLGVSYEWALLLVSWVSLLGAVIVLYKWLEFEIGARGKQVSPWAAIGVLAIFPTAIYFALPYTESFFMLVNLGAILAFRKRLYFVAMVLAGLAAATRYQGLVLPVFFVANFLVEKNKSHDYKKLLPIIGTIAGFGAYMVFMQRHYGSPFAFLSAEQSWGRLTGGFVHNMFASLRPDYIWYFPVLLIGLWAIWKELGSSYLIYSVLFILQPLSSGRFDSISRYMVSLAPLFLAVALLLQKERWRWLRIPYYVSSSFLLAWSLLLFVNDYWVA